MPMSLAYAIALAEARPWVMVNPAPQSAIGAMSLDERFELVEYIESTVDQSERQADPSIALTLEQLDARMGARWK